MPKRKDIANLDDLLGGKAGSTGTKKAPTPAATGTPRSGARKRKPKSPAGSDQLVSQGKEQTNPLAVRVPDAMIGDIGDIAQREGVAVPDLLRFALARFIKDYRAGKVKIGKAPAKARYKITL